MASDPLLTDLRPTVTEGERLRMHLLSVRSRAGRYAQGSSATELAMFYGQAFDEIHRALSTADEALPGGVALGSSASLVWTQALAGTAMHRMWMFSYTRIDMPEQMGQMAQQWEKIVGLVLGE